MQLTGVAATGDIAAQADQDWREGPAERRFPGAIAQLEEHLLCKQGVRGSSPLSSTTKFP